MQESRPKKRWGDRRDAYKVRDLDGLHFVMNIIMGKRTENEAHITQPIDLTALNAYLARKNESEEEFKYTFFHIIVTAVLKTVYLRPKLNRFIANKNMYQRHRISTSFVVKKKFSDDGAEGLAFIYAEDGDTVDTVHERIKKVVYRERKESLANSTDVAMDFFANKCPGFISKSLVGFITWLDKHGKAPKSMVSDDPYQSSVIISNLGSIKLRCGYHHLSNWGSNSLFCVVGEKEKRPVFQEDGSYELHEFLDLGLTIDERLADGYYYARSVALLKHLCEHPELLEAPIETEVAL